MKLTDIPNAEEIRASYDGEKIKEKWEERIQVTVNEILRSVTLANNGGSLKSSVMHKSTSGAEADYAESRFSEKGFEVYRGGYGELEIRWERDPRSVYEKTKNDK